MYCTSFHPSVSTSFLFYDVHLLKNYICIGSGNVSFGIVNGQISMCSDRVVALVNVQIVNFNLYLLQ